VAECDLNLCRQTQDSWGFRVCKCLGNILIYCSLADDPTAGFIHPKFVERNKARLSASGGEGEIKPFWRAENAEDSGIGAFHFPRTLE
jgi:hypothetical protein